MFGQSYFGRSYFGGPYWGKGASVVPPGPAPQPSGGGGYKARKDRLQQKLEDPPWYKAPDYNNEALALLLLEDDL